MNPFEMLFVPMVLFMVIVAPTWIVMHYRSVNRSSSQLSEDDRQALEDMSVAVDQMADRIESLESILDADHPNWRQERGGQTQEEVSRCRIVSVVLVKVVVVVGVWVSIETAPKDGSAVSVPALLRTGTCPTGSFV